MKTPVTRPERHEIPEGFVDGFADLADEIKITPLVIGTPARANEPFPVELPGLGTTGYSWSLRSPHEPLELLSEEVVSDESKFGAMGTHMFTFLSSMPGCFTLMFDSKRPGEESINESREYRINVKKPKRPA